MPAESPQKIFPEDNTVAPIASAPIGIELPEVTAV
jgi:hypothetical protein